MEAAKKAERGQPNTQPVMHIRKVSIILLENGVTTPQTICTSPTSLQQILTPVRDMEGASNQEKQTLHQNMADFHHVS